MADQTEESDALERQDKNKTMLLGSVQPFGSGSPQPFGSGSAQPFASGSTQLFGSEQLFGTKSDTEAKLFSNPPAAAASR